MRETIISTLNTSPRSYGPSFGTCRTAHGMGRDFSAHGMRGGQSLCPRRRPMGRPVGVRWNIQRGLPKLLQPPQVLQGETHCTLNSTLERFVFGVRPAQLILDGKHFSPSSSVLFLWVGSRPSSMSYKAITVFCTVMQIPSISS